MDLTNLFFWKRKPKLKYPPRFYIVDYTKRALELGLSGDINKIIYVYDFDEYGNRLLTKKDYSKEMVYALETVQKIPGIDKTKLFPKGLYPIFSEILPMEVEYT